MHYNSGLLCESLGNHCTVCSWNHCLVLQLGRVSKDLLLTTTEAKAEFSPLLFMADTRYCAVSSKSHLELETDVLHTQPLQITLTAYFEVHVRSPVNLQGVDIIAALQFVLPWQGHRINANIVLVPKEGKGLNYSRIMQCIRAFWLERGAWRPSSPSLICSYGKKLQIKSNMQSWISQI